MFSPEWPVPDIQKPMSRTPQTIERSSCSSDWLETQVLVLVIMPIAPQPPPKNPPSTRFLFAPGSNAHRPADDAPPNHP